MASDVSTVVSVCRGIGTGTDQRLSTYDWDRLKNRIWSVVSQHCGPPVSDNEGTWFYQHEGHSKSEAQYLVVGGEFPRNRQAFEDELAWLAFAYCQDSIAVLYGVPTFIEAQRP